MYATNEKKYTERKKNGIETKKNKNGERQEDKSHEKGRDKEKEGIKAITEKNMIKQV